MKVAHSIGMLLFIYACIISCATRNVVIKPTPKDILPVSMPVVAALKLKQDTIPPKKQIGAKEFNALVNGAYKYNFDNLLAPKFDQLLLAHKAQTEANKSLSDYMVETRRRLDSIVRERNFYRSNDVKARQEALSYQKQAIQFQQDIIKLQKDATAKNDKQIVYNTGMAIGGLVGVIVLFVAYISLYVRVRSINKKIDSIINTMPNA